LPWKFKRIYFANQPLTAVSGWKSILLPIFSPLGVDMNFNSQQDQGLRDSERRSDLPQDFISTHSIEKGSDRLTVPEIAGRLRIGRLAVYAMLERGIIPGIRLGRRWIITRHAYQHWERGCGLQSGAGLAAGPEVTVLN
jgi:excisionase family DNA binding protein